MNSWMLDDTLSHQNLCSNFSNLLRKLPTLTDHGLNNLRLRWSRLLRHDPAPLSKQPLQLTFPTDTLPPLPQPKLDQFLHKFPLKPPLLVPNALFLCLPEYLKALLHLHEGEPGPLRLDLVLSLYLLGHLVLKLGLESVDMDLSEIDWLFFKGLLRTEGAGDHRGLVFFQGVD